MYSSTTRLRKMCEWVSHYYQLTSCSQIIHACWTRLVSLPTWLYIWVTWRVSYKKQELFTLREHTSLPPDFWLGPCCPLLLIVVFWCFAILCLYVQSPVLSCPLRFPYENYIRFVFSSSCLSEGSCRIYFICVCLNIVQKW